MLAYGAHLDLNCVVMIILTMILPFLGLLFWLENKVTNSSEVNPCSKWKELLQISDEINSVFYQHDEDNTSLHCACSFCGRLSNVYSRCSRCKTAMYCSNACHVMHRRICHKYECVDVLENQEETPSHGTQFLLKDPKNDKYSFNEVEQKIYKGDVYNIEGGENSFDHEFSDETAMPRHRTVNCNNGCAVCGNPTSKLCSRCKTIKYCSRTCQHFDWRSGHKFQCLAEKASSTEAAMVNQERHDHGKVVNVMHLYEEEDNAYSSSPLCLEYYSGNINSRALISSSLSQEGTNTSLKKVEEQLKSLKEELAKINHFMMILTLCVLHFQLFLLKHENELMSSAEKQARQMVNSLSQRLHCLQIAVESGVEERKKQEEYIHMLQKERAQAKIELHEQNKCIKRLKLELDMTTQFPVRITEETRQKLVNAFSEIAGVESNAAGAEVSQPISLSRNPTFTRQGCSICLTNEKNMAFGCGHMTCLECGSKIHKCHICRRKITSRIRLFPD
uniref:E3 ubiquitin-protein ligase RGLG1 n=1 Tax=Cajanus cajan TaxID=3821 RepID=A0A151TPT8_CAJCA|nr:E3 ubiquitin-protein ligase RGLG1 [Cajanus cajan]